MPQVKARQSPPFLERQVALGRELCRGLPKAMKQYMVAEGAGHYGIFSGRRWREIICPKIRAFIRDHA